RRKTLPQGHCTDFCLALQQLHAEAARCNPAAIVLVSDGVDTEGLSPDEARLLAKGLPPVFCVPVGGESQIANIALLGVDCPQEVKAGVRVTVPCVLTIANPRVSRCTLRWRTTAGPEGQVSVDCGRAGRQVARFSFSPSRPGRHRLEVRIDAPQEADLLAADSSIVTVFDVIPPDRRLVLLAGSPNPEFAALRRLVGRVEGIQTSAAVKKARGDGWWLETPRLEKLASVTNVPGLQTATAYLIMAAEEADLPRDVWETIARRVERGEAALAVAGGPQAARLPKALQDLLPARLGQMQARAVGVRPPGKATLDLRHDVWSGLPALAGIHALGPLARGSRVVLQADDGSPLLAVHEDGELRTAIIAADTTFRWVFSETASDTSAAAYSDLWLKTIAWLLRPRPPRGLTLVPDGLIALAGETLTLRAYASPDADEVRVDVWQGQRRLLTRRLERVEAARFEGEIADLAAGVYKLRAHALQKGRTIASDELDIQASDQSREWRWARPDVRFLQAIADCTGGRLVPISRLEQLPQMLPVKQHEAEVTSRWDPFRSLFAGIAALALLLADWGLRRRWGLV
ncbi:MAG: hypothetical protein H5T86_09795, partial [Armatimonadetes bacterium]|nr:hypothetical protein [Armatimonadota bacterium]